MSEPVSMGAVNDSAADVLRRHLNPALVGPAWDALIAAIATGDQNNWDTARLAFDQLFTSTASGVYLTRRAADDGIERPENVGMSDEMFRNYTIKRSTSALTEESLLEMLEVFYGRDAVRAHAQTEVAEPFILSDGDDLTILVDERLVVPVTFSTADFAVIGQARGAEVAAAITRAFRVAGSTALALDVVDPLDGSVKVRIYSGALGLASSVRVTGGKAQDALSFPHRLALTSGLPTWTITVDLVAGTTRYAATSPVDLSQLRVGDYVNIFGSPFQAANRGSFPVINVFFAYTPGLVQYFEVAHVGTAQAAFAQVADTDVEYFRPERQTIYNEANRAVIVASLNDEVDVVLPATSAAVVRQAPHAAYAQGAAPLASVVSAVRLNNGIVTVNALAHGLSIGDQVFIDGIVNDTATPPTDFGNGTSIADARNVSIAAQLAAMGTETIHHAAVLVRDGRVFVTGGNDAGFTYLTTVQIFHVTSAPVLADGATQYHYQYDGANPMNHGVRWHTLTLLRGGQILKAGGDDGIGGTNVCELCDPTAAGGSGAWTITGSLAHGRYRHTATLMPDGRVLVIGGTDVGTGLPTTSCEFFDPGTQSWSAGPTLNVARQHHTATLMPNGDVLVTGGGDSGIGGNSIISCELLPFGGPAWNIVGQMTRSRQDHAAVLLPNGRVLVIAGEGFDPTNEVGNYALPSTELYDSETQRWQPGPSMIVGRGSVQVALVAKENKVYALGDFQQSIEYLDLDRMVWRTSLSALSTNRNDPTVTLMGDGVSVFVAGGAQSGFGAQKINFLLSLPSETFNAGEMNGPQTILAVPDADHFTYQTQQLAYTSALVPPTVTPMAAPSAPVGMPGPFVYDPQAGLAVTGVVSTTTVALAGGEQYGEVDVVDATQFPDEPGWLVFSFGFENQQAPVRYLGRLSNTALALDFSYRFTMDVPVGATVTRLAQKGGFVPDQPEEVGSFYVTASPAGRVAAQAAVQAMTGAGIPLDLTIVYPGDRGIGGEGLPAEGVLKLSDKVAAFAGDDVDAEIAAAREGI